MTGVVGFCRNSGTLAAKWIPPTFQQLRGKGSWIGRQMIAMNFVKFHFGVVKMEK